jgi:peptidoglycan glycosyltransferase
VLPRAFSTVDGWLYLARPVLAMGVVAFALVLWIVDRRQRRRERMAALQGVSPVDLPAASLLARRSLERWGLVLASVVTAAYAVALKVAAPAPPHAIGAVVILAVFWTLHAVLVGRGNRGDELLLPICALLVGLGCLEIDRLQPAQAEHQVVWLIVSAFLVLATMFLLRDYRRLEDYKYVMLFAALLLQISVMLFGTEVNGAKLWIKFGTLFQFQPVELVKVLLIAFLAGYLRQNRAMLTLGFGGEERRISLRYMLPLLLVAVGAELIFVIQRDMGQGLLFFGIFLGMYFATTRRLGVVLLTLLAFIAMSWLCYKMFGHVRVRFENWLDPWKAPADEGYQMVQALYSLASGGWFGSGVWRGQPWLVPEASTDFIFVAITEELGTIVAITLVACFALLVARALRAARLARDDFGALLACGIGAVLGCQAFVIVAGTIRMIPMTGITLPFVSYGGTSLVVNMLMIALLLEISHAPPLHDPEPRRIAEGLRFISLFFGLLLVAPALYLVGFQMMSGDELATSPANLRTREDLRARGMIVDRRRTKLAWTAGPGGKTPSPPWQEVGIDAVRRYVSADAFGNVVGYHSLRYGSAGLERALDPSLEGTIEPHNLWQAAEIAAGRSIRGDNVILTIDADLQTRAFAALGTRKGAVVALDPRNGEILALASTPGFDSGRLERDWSRISSDQAAPLINRALEGTYPPGSVIKPAVVAMALDQGSVRVGDTFSCPGYLDVDGRRIHDAQGEVHGTVDVSGAVAGSCNIALGRIAMAMGIDPFLAGLAKLGLGVASSPGLPTYAGNVPGRKAVTPEMLAQMGFGQGPLLVTPLQVALFTAAIADHGKMMAPHLVRARVRPSGTEERVPATVWRTPFSAAAADAVVPMMEAVVTRGTGTAARIPEVRVAGKTGTAENPHGPPHAWFAAFAPAEAPRVVVVVVVENGGWGAEAAAPIAREVLEAALAEKGEE